MPDKYRFQKGFGKFFLRKYSEKYISSSVAWFPKKGMGHYAWDNFKGFFNEIKARKVIKNSKLFSKNLFKKKAKLIIFNKNVHKANLWIAFVLAQTFDYLEEINKKKSL